MSVGHSPPKRHGSAIQVGSMPITIPHQLFAGRRLQQGYGSYGVEGIAAGTARGADTTAATDVVALQNLIISPWNLQSAPYEDQTSTVGSTITFEW
jgi:hypothetical protein